MPTHKDYSSPSPLADPPIPLIYTLEEGTIDLPEEEGPGDQGASLAASHASEAVSSGVGIKPGSATSYEICPFANLF